MKKSGIPSSDIVVVYCTMIRTMVEYATVFFANLSQTLSNDLERVQKRALSIIYPSYSYTDERYVLAEKKLATNLLQILKQVSCCTFIHKTANGVKYHLLANSTKKQVELLLWIFKEQLEFRS